MNWATERNGSVTCTDCRHPHSLWPRTASRYLDMLSSSVITQYKNFFNLAAVVKHKNPNSMIVQLRCMARTMINDSKEDTSNGPIIVVRTSSSLVQHYCPRCVISSLCRLVRHYCPRCVTSSLCSLVRHYCPRWDTSSLCRLVRHYRPRWDTSSLRRLVRHYCPRWDTSSLYRLVRLYCLGCVTSSLGSLVRHYCPRWEISSLCRLVRHYCPTWVLSLLCRLERGYCPRWVISLKNQSLYCLAELGRASSMLFLYALANSGTVLWYRLWLTPHLVPRLKKEYSYTSTPPLDLHGLFWGELYIFMTSSFQIFTPVSVHNL